MRLPPLWPCPAARFASSARACVHMNCPVPVCVLVKTKPPSCAAPKISCPPETPGAAASGSVIVGTNGHLSNAHAIKVATAVADNLHPVTSPALDREGNLYVTFSG